MAKLSHPNVVTVHDVGTYKGQLFMALEFVPGQTLARWLSTESRSTREILDVFAAAGRGLAAAHQAGLVHRDFKPANVLVGGDGRVKVTDFGLAVTQAPSGSSASPAFLPRLPKLTMTGTLLGTPAYMSPEQFSLRESDAKSDQFSFCVALYEALYGQRPFAGKDAIELAVSVLQGEMRPLPEQSNVPPALRDALLRGLRTDPEARYPSMEALLEDLLRERDAPVPEPSRRKRVLLSLFVLVMLFGGVAAVAYRSELRSLPQAETPPPASSTDRLAEPTALPAEGIQPAAPEPTASVPEPKRETAPTASNPSGRKTVLRRSPSTTVAPAKMDDSALKPFDSKDGVRAK
jgi:serine/threonine protein kinase